MDAAEIRRAPDLAGAFDRALAISSPRWTVPSALPGTATLDVAMEWVVLGLAIADDPGAGLTPAETAALRATSALLQPRQRSWIATHVAAVTMDRLVALAAELAPVALPAATPPTKIQIRADISTRGLKTARLATGMYDPALDPRLRERGYDVVAIEHPDREELATLVGEHGFHLVPSGVRYLTRAASEEAFLEALDSKQRSRSRNMLKRSAPIPPSVGALDQEGYAEWFEIYKTEVLGKPGGTEFFHADHVAALDRAGTKQLWHRLWFRDPAAGAIVGGAIAMDFVQRGFFTVAGAAFLDAWKVYDLSIRTFVTSLELARAGGWNLLAYGSDPNFYGYDLSLGLVGYKLALGLTPYPEGTFELIKVLDPAKFEALDKPAGYFFFAVKPESELWTRYLAARDRGEPLAHELLGGPYLTASCLSPADSLIARHFYGDPQAQVRTPYGVELVREPMRR